MAINAKYLVSLPPRTIGGGSADLETNGLLLTKSDRIPLDKIALEFGSLTAVSAYFGEESTEAVFAQQYFTGLTNQQKAPKTLVIGRRIDAPLAAWVRSAPLTATLEDLKKIQDGSIKFTVDGAEKKAATVNFSTANSLSDVAKQLATAVKGVTGTYDSLTNSITLTSSTTGKASKITFGANGDSGTDLAEKLGFTEKAGAVLSQGEDKLTVATNMARVTAVTANFSQFTTAWEVTEAAEAEELAAWSDLDDDYIYVFWSSDTKMCDQATQESTVAFKLKDKFNTVFSIYAQDVRTAAFAVSYPATIAWQLNQGMKVLFGKSTTGISPSVTEQAQAEALDKLRVSYIGPFATRNAQFQFANRGALTSHHYGWYDVLIGSIWLRSKVQRSIMDGFASVNRVPYNEQGYAIVNAWLQDPINAAKKVGVIDEGIALSEAQKAQILQETGDKSAVADIQTNGFYVQILDPESNVRTQRGSPVMNLYYAYAGSIQTVEMPVTTVL